MLFDTVLAHFKIRIMISNIFKTEEDRVWHTKTQFEAQTSYDKARIEAIKRDYDLDCKRLSQNVIRITDGNKRLDLYETRYFKVDTGERGNIRDKDKLIREYFNLC
jgi:hypothetical protein